MEKLFFRHLFRRFYQYFMKRLSVEYDSKHFKRSALVFSPHQDDETLGCGGTIIKKKRAGANVKIVFTTDGRASHRRFIDEELLKSVRMNEAIAASRVLGVKKEDVIFLEFKNEKLHESYQQAVQSVFDLLHSQRPDELFIPYHREQPLDHAVTNRIILSAVQKYNQSISIYEYPIWFWHHWPWIGLQVGSRRQILPALLNSVVSNLKFLQHFRYSIDVGDVLEQKWMALEQHKSQMTQLIPHPEWKTLADVADGEFLQCFFQQTEIFYKYQFHGNS